jgi:hypothetical protein
VFKQSILGYVRLEEFGLLSKHHSSTFPECSFNWPIVMPARY